LEPPDLKSLANREIDLRLVHSLTPFEDCFPSQAKIISRGCLRPPCCRDRRGEKQDCGGNISVWRGMLQMENMIFSQFAGDGSELSQNATNESVPCSANGCLNNKLFAEILLQPCTPDV